MHFFRVIFSLSQFGIGFSQEIPDSSSFEEDYYIEFRPDISYGLYVSKKYDSLGLLINIDSLYGEKAISQFLYDNVKIPEICSKKNSEGRVLIQFMIKEDGSVFDIKVARNNTGCDEYATEAIRVISSMPNWIPAYQKGKAITTGYWFMPFNFKN